MPAPAESRAAESLPATVPDGFPVAWPESPAVSGLSIGADPDAPGRAAASGEPELEGPAADPVAAAFGRASLPSRVGGLARRLLPASWRGARLDLGRPGAVVLALVVVAAAVVAAVGVWLDRPEAAPVSALPAAVVDEPATATPPPAPAGPLVVSVSGKVARPGLVEVPDGARVADVLDAAGGVLPGTDLTSLNLARKVGDGEQVAVGAPTAPPAAVGPTSGADPAAPAGKVDLNAATVQQLDALPGVGPVMAQRILDWRTRNGRFARLEQLRDVEGIGERRFAQLRELVTV